MMKNRFLAAFAFAGLLGFAACADEPEVVEEPVVEEPVVEPVVEPAPATVDTFDTTAVMQDTVAGGI